MNNVISTYTIEQATEDKILFDMRNILKEEFRDKTLISHITTNLMRTHNYSKFDEKTLEDKPNIPNIFDLFNQSMQILKRNIKSSDTLDNMYAGDVETPNGEKLRIWLCLNELRLITVMLPEDY